MSCNICETDLPDHEQIACTTDLLNGGINGYAILKCGHTIEDYTDATQWQTNITNGKVKIVKYVDGQVPKASAVTSPNPNGCGVKTIVSSFDRTFTATDFNVSPDNNDFYDAANAQAFEGLVLFHCADEQISVVENPSGGVLFQAFDITPNDSAQKRTYDITASWRSLTMPELMAAPAGIFG